MKITVLSPHQGDAAFSVGLAVEAWLRGGHAVQVLNCFTKSDYSPFSDLEFIHGNDRRSYVMGLRRREDVRWSRQYRPEFGLTDLGLRDAPQRLRCAGEAVCGLAANPGDGAIPKIRKALEGRKMDALVLPRGLGDHVDHATARMAAEEGWGPELAMAFYEDLPYAARPGVAEGTERRVREVAAEVGELRPVFASEAGDTRVAVARKCRLALCYDSQIDSATTEAIGEFCVRYGGRERLWANDAWRGCALKGAAS